MNKLSCKVRAKLRKKGWTIANGVAPSLHPTQPIVVMLRYQIPAFLREANAHYGIATTPGWRWDFSDSYDIVAWKVPQ